MVGPSAGFVASLPLRGLAPAASSSRHAAATSATGAPALRAATTPARRPTSSPPPPAPRTSRRALLSLAAVAAATAALGGPGGPAANAGAVRRVSQMTGDYKTDAARMLQDMREATDLARGTPGMADTVARVRADMNDFVALYRRNDKVAGSASYSVLYTATNTLSGHYASYGPNYPVPEKRKKRLQQQFTEVERALARGR